MGCDQIVSAEKTGNEYIFVRGGGDDSWENVFLLVDQDDTEIFINGSSAGTSNAGEIFIIEGNRYAGNGTMHVKSGRDDDKIFAYQFIGDVWMVEVVLRQTNMILYHHLIVVQRWSK